MRKVEIVVGGEKGWRLSGKMEKLRIVPAEEKDTQVILSFIEALAGYLGRGHAGVCREAGRLTRVRQTRMGCRGVQQSGRGIL